MPFNKKATGINIIILVSKSITIGAPFVNELEEPIPIVVIIVLAVLSILIVSFFKSLFSPKSAATGFGSDSSRALRTPVASNKLSGSRLGSGLKRCV